MFSSGQKQADDDDDDEPLKSSTIHILALSPEQLGGLHHSEGSVLDLHIKNSRGVVLEIPGLHGSEECA
ncbi:unnamed protein product, partial [Brenthis ino]